MKERQYKDFQMRNIKKIHISYEKPCDHILICEINIFVFPVKEFVSRFHNSNVKNSTFYAQNVVSILSCGMYREFHISS